MKRIVEIISEKREFIFLPEGYSIDFLESCGHSNIEILSDVKYLSQAELEDSLPLGTDFSVYVDEDGIIIQHPNKETFLSKEDYLCDFKDKQHLLSCFIMCQIK